MAPHQALGGQFINHRRFSFLTVALISGLLLSSCSTPSGFKALERPATSTDKLPAGVDFRQPDLDKVLLVAETGGNKYFLGQNAEKSTACLAVFPVDNPSGWHSACSAGGARVGKLLGTSGPSQESSILVSDGYDTKELEASGYKKIHENILVAGG